ncbi:MAG: hypothetical protein JWN78_811 [Bacteroidota bacterium]|nr:hypothetical protein [Bacteroidota bacterium]
MFVGYIGKRFQRNLTKELLRGCVFRNVVPMLYQQKNRSFLIGCNACPGTDLNRYSRCGEQDFKSCVSTNSTTRASLEKKSSLFPGGLRAEDRARTGHPDLGKVVLYQMSYFRNYCKNFFPLSLPSVLSSLLIWECKNSNRTNTTKFSFQLFLFILRRI